jgi:hypothetical protein
MDHQVIETLMDHEYDAVYNSLLYFTGGDISEKDIAEADTYTRRMFRAGTTPESEKSQIILEEAIYQEFFIFERSLFTESISFAFL